jgi:lambda family phage portal protein
MADDRTTRNRRRRRRNRRRNSHRPKVPAGALPVKTPTEHALMAENAKLRRQRRADRESAGYRQVSARGPNQNWRPVSEHPDVELDSRIELLRACSRDLVTSRGLPKGYLQKLQDNVIGDGIKPVPQARFRNSEGLLKTVNRQLKEIWEQLSPIISADRIRNMAGLQNQILRTWAEAGASLLYMPYFEDPDAPIPLQVQGIEPDYLGNDRIGNGSSTLAGGNNNEIRRGIELDPETGRIIAFHVQAQRGPYSGPDIRRLPASDCVYCFNPDRWGQTIGAPFMAATLGEFEDLGDYFASERTRARHFAKRTHYIKTKNARARMQALTQLDEPNADGTERPRIEEIYEGTTYLNDDEDVVALDVNVPPTGFKDFSTHQTRHMVTGIGVSYEGLLGDYSQTHFSASRAAWQADVKFYRSMQRMFIHFVLQPLWERMVRIAVISGALDVSRARFISDPVYRFHLTRVRWRAPGFAWFDPVKDVQAAETSLALGLTSRQRICDERGVDFFEILDELAEEEEAMRTRNITAVSFPGHLQRMLGEPPPGASAAPGEGQRDEINQDEADAREPD